MSGAPKTARTLLPLPGERALFGEEPFGQPQETITQPTEVPSTRGRRDRTGRHGRSGRLAPQALAEPLPAHSAAHPAAAAQPAVVTDAASYMNVSAAHLLAAPRQAKASSAPAVKYTVRPGDSLSAIAGTFITSRPHGQWSTGPTTSQIKWANDISAGQVLRIPAEPAKIPSAPALLGPAAPVGVAAPAAAPATPTYAPAQSTAVAASGYSGGTGSFGQCVVARESGGNSQVMNSSGHYGLYQFSEGTWVASGRSAADFGNASVGRRAEPGVRQRGGPGWPGPTGPAYDGC